MGVPKFFRYMSERYPCLSEFVKEYQIPEFDNLYLDMNGIIHMCSHPDDNDPHFRITEERLFADIFHYIEVLFRMIKPQKVFFMAIDGVAPRAKMNQQRGRRFRSAKDAEKAEADAKKKGERLPDVARFDSNCITPGTEFMAKLHEQLKYFVVNKVSTEKLWKRCKVILSGHETPGEGEHKIMDYIRYIRAQPGYDPNTRHCLYGLDADLIMLGLCTHDPHFSLLREEVKFGRKSTKRNNVPEEIRFYLLHLSLMREYLELEFAPLKDSLDNSGKFKFDIEKVIDDWVLMGFLVGNDFIPHLPNFHITNDTLPKLYKAYMDVLPKLDGYINEGGTLNLERFETFMKELSTMDFEHFEEVRDDMIYMKSKTKANLTAHPPVSSKCGSKTDDKQNGEDSPDQTSRPVNSELQALIKETEDMFIDSSDDEEDTFTDENQEAFKNFKNEYYRNKLEYRNVTKDVLRDQAEGYVRAIQWNLNYYYNGVSSWSWYYPHHYAPYISDVKGFSNLDIKFDLGTPFKPYEQLLAVLPAASKDLLPKCYHSLMTDDGSLIKDYYPEDFQTDLNGKKQEWEAVVLVPFIDENILLEAMEPCNQQLTLEEATRNTHGPMLLYQYVDEDLGVYWAPAYFPAIENHAKCTPLYIEDVRVEKEKLVKGAYPGAKFDVFYPGFPTMKHLKYKGELRKARVKVFEHPSRNENMVLSIISEDSACPENDLPLDLLGTTVFVGWPHLVEAKVVAVSNGKRRYNACTQDSNKKYEAEERAGNLAALFKSEVEGVTQQYMNAMGVDFGDVSVLVHVKTMTGRRYMFTANGRVNLEKQFASAVSSFPLQGVVRDIKVHDECRSTYQEISDVFPVGSNCFNLSNPHYGTMGTILDSTDTLKNDKLKVALAVVDEPDFTDLLNSNENLRRNYLDLYSCASQLAISNYVFSRVTGSLFITTGTNDGTTKSMNVGLDLKFNKKNQETPGYTKKIDSKWFYSNKSVDLVRTYFEKFPEIFEFLTGNNEGDDLKAEDIFGEDGEEKVKSIQVWLKTLPTYNIERRVCHSSVLEPDIVAEIEKITDEAAKNETVKNIVLQLRPQLLYRPEIQVGNVAPDPLAKTRVFDRVVNVREGFTVPLGFKGTVTAVHKSANSTTDRDEMYDIVFDKPFGGGLSLNCSENRGYRLPKTSFINLTHGRRIMEEKTGKPGERLAQARANQTTNNFRATSAYNVNGRYPQNSAFAPVNNTRSVSVMPNQQNKNNFYYNQYPYPTTPNTFYQQNQRSQPQINPAVLPQGLPPANKNDRTDFMPTYTPKVNKENVGGSGPQRNREGNWRTKQHSPPKKVSEERAKVDTDYLKKLLRIQDDMSKTTNKTKNGLNSPVSNKPTVLLKAGPSQNKDQNKDKLPINASATARLMSYYQANNLGCPRYMYFDTQPGFCVAQVLLPNRKLVAGVEAKTKEEASENVAMEVLKTLNADQTSSKQMPSVFPEPPEKWVAQGLQKPQNADEVYTNKNYQTPNNQKSPKSNTAKKNPSQASKLNADVAQLSKGVVSDLSPSSSSFVPLQAIIKQAAKTPKNAASAKKQGAQSSNEKNKSTRRRRTRIAANFIADKS